MDRLDDKKVFYRSLLALVVPMALQNLISVGVQSADVIMLGGVGEVAISAASLAGQVQFIMTLLFFGMVSGATVLTAQYWGRGDIRTIEKVTAKALRFSVLVACVFTAAALLFPGALMRIFSPEEDVIREGARYLRLVAPSYLFMAYSNTFFSIMRSVEKVGVATATYSISFVVNVIFNAIFIFGLLGAPAMGTAGAALGTTLARLVELGIALAYTAKNGAVHIRWKDFFHKDKLLSKDFLHYAMPTTVNELLWGVAISTNAAIVGHLGAAAVAANSVASVVRQLAMVACFGIANATAIMVGKTLGSGELEKGKAYASRCVRVTLVAAVLGGGLIFLLRPLVLASMNLSPEAMEYLRFLTLMMCFYVFGAAFSCTMVIGIFRSGGDTRFALYMDVGVMWGICVPLAALGAFVFHWPVIAIYIVILSDEFIKIPICWWRYKSMKWLRNVTRDEIVLEDNALGANGG